MSTRQIVGPRLIAVVVCCLLAPLQLHVHGMLHTVHIYNFDFNLCPAGEPVLEPVIAPGYTVRWFWDRGRLIHPQSNFLKNSV